MPTRSPDPLSLAAVLAAAMATVPVEAAAAQADGQPAARLAPGPTASFGEGNDGFGFAVATVGDWNGDGTADVAASAPAIGESQPGVVWVVSGTDGATLARFVGEPGAEFGYALAGGIDFDGDGVGDLAVGARNAPVDGSRRGHVQLFSGRLKKALEPVLEGPTEGAQFGSALAVVDDVDADGTDDLAIGSPGASGNRGAVHLISGRSRELIELLSGKRPGARYGAAVAAAGDVDGDRRGDLLVGSPEEDSAAAGAGAVRVIHGRTLRTLKTVWGTDAYERFGSRVAGLGDVTGDGRSEFAVSAPTAAVARKADVGRVLVFDGASGERRFELLGQGAGDFFGRGLAAGLDADGDGWPDLAVGAPYAATESGRSRERTGRITVFSGLTGAPIQRLEGGERGQLFGWSVALWTDPRERRLRLGLVAGGPGRRETPPQVGDPPTRPGRLRVFPIETE